MLVKSEALELGAVFIKKAYPDKVDSLVFLPEKCVEYPFGWAIRFDWKEHLETGNIADAPFTSVVIVPHDGEAAHFPPTAFPVAEYMNRRASGDLSADDGRPRSSRDAQS
ncbi:serine protease [Streptomyces sp. NPDC051554]|uniref:serine protease n=1 Tax=Streptomyces sp. NPDC051554 TaxID=3365656 RepID=UPI003789E850